ncbi:MAG TPA: LacI family DNA-binding transcriptional regulator [Prolixibacteraceae bacterium]|nr:LacI family DNA-binding transcriptional regulator [Prolixibacteraceae bacterium]
MENRKTTIHDIAARLNISASTVSRALNDYYRISKTTRDLIKKTAAEMNYKPNQLATNLRKGRGNMIGVIIPRIDRHFFSHAIAGMESVINPSDFNLMICQTNEDYMVEKRSLQALVNNRVEGIIISMAAGSTKTDHIEATLNEGIPLVMFDRVADHLDIDKVLNDNFAGAYDITTHLIRQGYRNIVHFSGPRHINVYRDRFEGYQKAMQDAGMEVTDSMVFEDILTRQKGEELAEQLLRSGKLPDAIFSSSDFSALGALLFFKSKGVAIPRQIGIAGFANEPFTELTTPGITTLEQYSEEIGKSTARLLIERIESGKKEVSKTMTFKPKLIIRASTEKK